MKKHFTEQTAIFFSVTKWMFLSSSIGIIIGAIVTVFLTILHMAEENRSQVPFHYYYLLPAALFLTVWVVQKFAPSAQGHGTEKVIEAVHKHHGKIDIKVIPVKLLATLLTIFTGGSVGKEGPGAQIGAGAASLLLAMRKSEMLEVKVGQEIEDAVVNLDDHELKKIKNIRDKLQKRREHLQKRRFKQRKNK